MNPMRGVGWAAVWDSAVDAGIMASNKGSPTATPAPRRNVRRESCFLVMNMDTPSNFRHYPQRHRGISRCPCVSVVYPSVALRRNLTHLERRALHDPHHDGRKSPILTGR